MKRVPDSETTFAITADSGKLETEAVLLIRSLREVYPDAPLLIFIPESSVNEIDPDVYQYFRSTGHIVLGEIPIFEYPISALIQSFVESVEVFDTKYYVALDTDTLVFDHLHIRDCGDVWLRPADVGAQYWTAEASRHDWEVLYERFELETPTQTEKTTASVDRKTIPPYWNSGVVITTDQTLPSRWLEYTRALFYEDRLPVSTGEFFIDQLSLALAVRHNDVSHLNERENFPLGGRILVPNDVAVVHYGDRRNLARVFQQTMQRKLQRIDAVPNVGFFDLFNSLLVVLSTKSGRILSYRQKETIRSVVRRIFSRP